MALVHRIYRGSEACASPYQPRSTVEPDESLLRRIHGRDANQWNAIDRTRERTSRDTRAPCFRVNQRAQAPNQGIEHVGADAVAATCWSCMTSPDPRASASGKHQQGACSLDATQWRQNPLGRAHAAKVVLPSLLFTRPA